MTLIFRDRQRCPNRRRDCNVSPMIPFQLHRRIPLIRRPFDQRDAAMKENAVLKAELIETQRAMEDAQSALKRSIGRTHYLKQTYTAQVERTASYVSVEEAMSTSIGGDFDYVGAVEVAVLKRYGLSPDHRVIDVGCGSGRLALPLSSYLRGSYSGFDIVDDLVAYARKAVQRPDWRFATVDHIEIPEPDGCADMVCFFSVLTHLLHEQSYWYLEEARRVVKPGGTIVVSFLEFADPEHWPIFTKLLAGAKTPENIDPLSVFHRAGCFTCLGAASRA